MDEWVSLYPLIKKLAITGSKSPIIGALKSPATRISLLFP
jgi:hypothetical protein